MTEQIENKQAISGEVQLISPRQRLFKTYDAAVDFIRFCNAKRVYMEAITTPSRQQAWVVEYTGSQGEES